MTARGLSSIMVEVVLGDFCENRVNMVVTQCYVRILKESGHCRKRRVGELEVRLADSY